MPGDCPGMGGEDVEALIWLAHYNLQSRPEAIGTIELYRQKGGKKPDYQHCKWGEEST